MPRAIGRAPALLSSRGRLKRRSDEFFDQTGWGPVKQYPAEMNWSLALAIKQEAQFHKVGDLETKETHPTDFISLGSLVERFNASLAEAEKAFRVDPQVVVIRDAIAHGRLLTSNEQLPYRLWKFGRPVNGLVSIEFCQELNVEWVKKTSDLIFAQKGKVVGCFNARGYQGLG